MAIQAMRANLTEQDYLAALRARPDPELDVAEILGQLRRSLVRWAVQNWKRALVPAGVAFVVSWLSNVVIIATVYDGNRKITLGAPVTAPFTPDAVIGGGAFWGIAAALAGGFAAYVTAVGPVQFGRGIRRFPAMVSALLRSPEGSVEHLLWGFAASMLVASILAPALNGLLAVAAVVGLTQAIRPVVTGVVSLAWRRVQRVISPKRRSVPSESVLTGAVLGVAPAMAAQGSGDGACVRWSHRLASEGITSAGGHDAGIWRSGRRAVCARLREQRPCP
jgi:hypothetical protein